MSYELETDLLEFDTEFEADMEAEPESDPEGESLLTHPSFGYGRRVSAEWEAAEPEAGPLLTHPTLGVGRLVSAEAEFEEEIEGEEEILGADDRKVVRNTTAAPYRWVCCLDLYYPDPDDSKKLQFYRGSGTLIGEKHVLTCGHNLVNNIEGSKGTTRKLAVKRIVVTPGRNGAATTARGKAPFGKCRAASCRTSDQWKASLDRQYDFGLIKLQRNLGGGSTGYWGSPSKGQKTKIEVVDPSAMSGKILNLSGYPGDKCKDQPPVGSASKAMIQACAESDWASAQWRASGSVVNPSPSGNPRLIVYNPDTFGGHSGSPVWFYYANGVRNLIAIHTGNWPPLSANRGVRLTAENLNLVKKWMST